MRKSVIAAMALGAVFVVLPAAAPASAQTGFTCGFASVTDPTGQAGVQTGEVHGGPVAAIDLGDPTVSPTADISITCTIQVGALNATHAAPDAASATSATTPAVAVLPPTHISYNAPVGQDVWLCTSVTVGTPPNTTTYYFDADAGILTTDPTVRCALAISQSVEPPPPPPGLGGCIDAFLTTGDAETLVACTGGVLTTCITDFIASTDVIAFLICLGL